MVKVMDTTDLPDLETAQKASNWEAKVDELLALKSIYCHDKECEIIAPSNLSFESLSQLEPGNSISPGGGSITACVLVHVPLEHLTKSLQRLCLKVVLCLGSGYPQDVLALTVAELSCEHLAVHVTDNILERLNIFISSLQPGPCLFETLEWLKDDVLNLVTNDPTLLPGSPSTNKYTGPCTEPSSGVVVDATMEDKITEKHDFTSKSVCAKPSPPGGLPETHVCIAKLDHMRNEQRYF